VVQEAHMPDGSSWDGEVTRRSRRLALRIPVRIEYFLEDPGRLATDTSTVVVSAHGALLRLPWGVPQGQQLQLQNLITKETQRATVAFVESVEGGNFDVGVEFDQPNPKFWGVSFPPNDWTPGHPDAKESL
jgi:PilZ domain-containing protein